jgi:hypothetical protein
MTFDGINYAAVLAAAIAAWILAIVWYQILIKQWLARQGKNETELGPRRYSKAYILWVFGSWLAFWRTLSGTTATSH